MGLPRVTALAALAIVLIAFAFAPTAMAFTGPTPVEKTDTARPLPDQATSASRTPVEPSFLERIGSTIRGQQQKFYRQFSSAVRALKDGYTLEASYGLIVVAFLYGVFHAAGPGHGKAVISAYMLANERSLRRGLILAAVASMAQAVTAVVLVYGFIFVLEATGRRIQGAASDLETLSYAMIVGLGGWMLWRSASPLLRRQPAHATAGGHSHGPTDGGHHIHHDHHGSHAEDCPSCGHAHMPSPQEVDRPLSIASALPIVLSIGLRPCTGAIVVLVFAHTLGLYAAGIGAAFVMAVGTALTVGTLAVLAVGARDTAARLIGSDSSWLGPFYRTVAIAGSGAVLILGGVLLHGALTAPVRPFL